MDDQIAVTNNTQLHRFEAVIDGLLSEVAYRQFDDTITFLHTEVPVELEGKGIAKALAKAALDHARDNGLKVVPLCPFIAAYIKRHPEYQPLVKTFQK